MAADNALVTPIVWSHSQSGYVRAQDRYQENVQPLPVTIKKIVGELVMVTVDMQGVYTQPTLLLPQAFSEWVREPTQVGDKGWAVPSNYYLGGQSGLGGGTANYRYRGNMTTLVFQHISQKAFPHNKNRDLNAVFINGPNGVVLQDTQGKCVFTQTPTGITIKIGGMTLTITSAGLDVEGGDIVNNHLTVGSTHIHGLVVAGTDNTGPPNP